MIGDPRLAVIGQGGSRAELRLSLPQGADVSVKIYNARGQLVRDLFSGHVGAGQQVLVWDGHDGQGRQAASGVYFVRAETGRQALTGRVVMVR
jgi:flagellar hook assembly protein FlgD